MIINNVGQKKDKYSSLSHVYPSISLLIHLSIHLIFFNGFQCKFQTYRLNTSACGASARVQYHKKCWTWSDLGLRKTHWCPSEVWHPRKPFRGWGQSGEPLTNFLREMMREGLNQGRDGRSREETVELAALDNWLDLAGVGEWQGNGRSFLPNFYLEPQLGTAFRRLKYIWGGESCRLNFGCNLFCLPCLSFFFFFFHLFLLVEG